MAIDKIIPIRLDKSSDFRLVPTTSMVDALNMLITENESSGDATTTGNLGVLKNIKGNEEITYLTGHEVAEGNAKIIGSVTDTKLKIIYFFLWHEILNEHGVYAYDQLGKLPIQGDTKGKIVRIHKSSLYAFPEHGFVKGDIIYTSQTRLEGGEIKIGTERDFEKDTILYFTDNTNEPRKINVYMAMLGAHGTYSVTDLTDFITACPKTPLVPVSFTFDNDPARKTSNFKSGPGFQFGYQFISKDGVESAISTYSDIAFSPSIINQGTLTDIDHNLYNRCKLMIPLGGKETKSIRIVAREFNNPEFVILDEVSNEQSEGYNWTVPSVTSGIPAGRGPQDGGGRDDPGAGPEPGEYYGCIDPSACNYDSQVTIDDGSCTYPGSEGYLPGSCTPIYYGCMTTWACNYEPLANTDETYEGSGVSPCIFPEDGYDCDGNLLQGNGPFGCTDPTACNYDPDAVTNSFNCTYPAADYDCDGNYLGSIGLDIINDGTNTAGAGDCVATVPHGVYFFYNDRIVRGVSDNEVNKQYDNLPRKAEAQAVVDNRLMYGNYLEGFNKVKTSCNATVRYQERPPEGFDFKLRLVPAISQVRDLEAQNTPGNANSGDADVHGVNKCAGYIIDSEDIPSTIPPYTKVSVSLSVSPKKNFHVYNAKNSYHQSRHRGAFSPYSENEIDYSLPPPYGISDPLNFSGKYGHQNNWHSGEEWLKETMVPGGSFALEFIGSQDDANGVYPWGIPYSGDNFGVTDPANPPKWKSDLDGSSEVKVAFGTSAGNPLIFSSQGVGVNPSFSFSCSFVFGANGVGADGNGPQAISSIVSELLTKGYSNWGGVGEGFLSNIEIDNKVVHEIDLGLENFQKIYPGDSKENLVTGVVRTHSGAEDDTIIQTGFGRPAHDKFRPPVGHFIVNKATVELALERDIMYSDITGDNPTEMLRLVINKVSDVETVTVVKKIFPNAPWSVLTSTFLDAPDINQFHSEMSLNGGYNITADGLAISDYTPNPSLGQSADGGIFEQNTFQDFNYRQLDNLRTLPEITYAVEGMTFVSDVNDPNQFQGKNYFPNLAECRSRFVDIGKGLGSLNFTQNNNIHNFFNHNREESWGEVITDLQNDGAETLPSIGEVEVFPFSLLDGQGGPGGDLGYNNEYQVPAVSSTYGQGAVNFGGSDYRIMRVRTTYGATGSSSVADITRHFSVQVQGPIFTGTINTRFIWSEIKQYDNDYEIQLSWLPRNNISGDYYSNNILAPSRTSLPLLQGRAEFSLDLYANDITTNSPWAYSSPNVALKQTPFYSEGAQLTTPWNLSFDLLHSHLEVTSVVTNIGSAQDDGISGDRTFKSSANHDFGVIYYDERGRHGFVDHLKTVYVAGYSSADRGNNVSGKSIIELELNHSPPNWAHHYKIAYTKNTTVQSFIQYSVGGAFPELAGGSGLTAKTNIYVSLNYLQESPVSYVADWGARNPEGGVSMFKHIPGTNQKVRIISAYVDAENKVWPTNYEFDILDVVLLGETENPIMEENLSQQNPEKMGEFLVLRNNASAQGFDYTSILTENNRWNNNCIIEIFTPQKKLEETNRFYYEIGYTYDIVNPGLYGQHQSCPIVLDKGDVWWRKVPVNLRDYDAAQGFVDLIQPPVGSAENDSSSNFKPIFLETETATDLFKGNASFIGRPNIIREDAVEVIREASITYSDKSNPNSSKVGYSSFNLTLSNFKELQEEFGDINYMCNMEGDVFVIQSDRCTLVPASKTLFSDVQGASTVAASKSPLGQERVFAGRAGCDNNPESVVQVGAYVYFAHKNLGKVYRFNPSNGVQEISEQGMASYFRGIFKAAMDASQSLNYNDVRVVGGFDPVNEEYLLTILDPKTYGVIEGSGGGGTNLAGVEDLTTINSLELQLKNVMTAFLEATQPDGVTPAFDITTLPQELQDFYNTTLTDGKDIGAFDKGEMDGIFNADEVISINTISAPVQESLNNFLVTELDITLDAMVELINRADVTTTERVLLYINSMMEEMLIIDYYLAGGVRSLNDTRKSRQGQHSQSALDASLLTGGIENPYWQNRYEVNSAIQEEQAAFDAVYAASGGEWTEEVAAASLALNTARLAFYEESGHLNKPSRETTLFALSQASLYHAQLQSLFSGAYADGLTDDDEKVGVAQYSSGVPMYKWGVENTGDYITPFTLAQNFGGVLEEFKVFLSGLHGNRMSIGGLTSIEAIEEIFPNDLLNTYLGGNPGLEAVLQSILTDNGITTGQQLTDWAVDQATVEEAIASKGISLGYINTILTQLESNGPVGFNKNTWKSDINNSGEISSADLLLFLADFGTTQNYNSSQNYLQDPNT